MNKKKLKTTLIILIALILCVNIGVYAYDFMIASTQAMYTKPDGTSTTVKEALNELYYLIPTKEIGDEVTVGGEQFYVLEWDNNSDVVLLMTKYNLNTEGTAQLGSSEITDTACVFSSSNYWKSKIPTNQTDPEYAFNLNDYLGFEETSVIGKAKSYGIKKGAVASRLLTYDEAFDLHEKSESNEKIRRMLRGEDDVYEYLFYWLGSAYDANNIWRYRGRLAYGQTERLHTGPYNAGGYGGVRPVITVEKSKIT